MPVLKQIIECITIKTKKYDREETGTIDSIAIRELISQGIPMKQKRVR